MKLVKSDTWWRLRGQLGPNNEMCKIDTLVTGNPRVFFLPETEEEKTFFNLDIMMYLTLSAYGPSTSNPDDPWGWRFFPELATEEVMKKFEQKISDYMIEAYKNMHAAKQDGAKPPILN